jgi:uncharacterized protein (DUF2236 family)
MAHFTQDSAGFVSRSDSESLLAAVAARTVDPIAGVFGPGSMSWRINRESALFLGAGRAALLQLAHPWVTAALPQHSSLLDKPIARFHNTFRVVFTMIFGTLDQAVAAARHLYNLHTRIRGELSHDVANWPRGSHYEANDIAALRWVYSTLVESAVLAYECAVGPLAASDRDHYYSETKTLAALFGIPSAALPENWNAFEAFNLEMQSSGSLGVSNTARTMAHNLLAGAGSWIRPPFWYRALTTAWLPERFRREFSLDFGAAEQRAAEQATQRLFAIYHKLPERLRFIGPWRQAQARISCRRPGPFTRLSNRFWIGQPLMPFASGVR